MNGPIKTNIDSNCTETNDDDDHLKINRIETNIHKNNSSLDIQTLPSGPGHQSILVVDMKTVFETTTSPDDLPLALASDIVIDSTTTETINDNEMMIQQSNSIISSNHLMANGTIDKTTANDDEHCSASNNKQLSHSNHHVNNDSHKLSNNSTSISNNPKEFGKFRILKNYALNNDDELSPSIRDDNSYYSSSGEHNHSIMNNNVSLTNGTTSSLELTLTTTTTTMINGGDHEYVVNDIGNEIDVLATNNDCQTISQQKSSEESNHIENKTPTKRRGKPKRVNSSSKKTDEKSKNDKSNNEIKPLRRRSTRLKNLGKSSKGSEENQKNDENVLVNGDVQEKSIKSSKKDKSGKHHHKSSKSDKDKTPKKHKKSKSKHKSDKEKDKSSTHHHHSSSTTQSSKGHFALPQEPNNTQTKDSSLMTSEDLNGGNNQKVPEKVKSRWRRNSELENVVGANSSSSSLSCSPNNNHNNVGDSDHSNKVQQQDDHQNNDTANNQSTTEPMPSFQSIDENIFLFEKKKCKTKKETKKMVCDCILTKEERARGLVGCGDDCLNRMLMIECGSRCPLGDHCSNKRFTKKQYAKVEPFKTEKKGWGLKALEPMQPNSFIMEYVGEVIDPFMFHKRVEKYSKLKMEHYYFMALKGDEIIDATNKGNVTRFINHSCEPNAITQKWTVNGELRIGFFSIKSIEPGDEITFDYQFQRYGKKAQPCYCESKNCRGYIGSTENANILTDGSKIPKKGVKKNEDGQEENEDQDEDDFLEDNALDDEIDMLAENGGLRNRQQILEVSRLMLRADKCHQRIQLIEIIMSTIEIAYLRLFIDYHGLQIIWGWMVEAEDVDLKARLLGLLEVLPIPNKSMLNDSKVYQVVERWAAPDSPESQQYLKINDDKDCKTPSASNTPSKSENHEIKSPNETDGGGATPIIESVTNQDDQTEMNNNLDDNSSSNKTTTNPTEKKSSTDLIKLSDKIVIKSKTKTAENSGQNNSNTAKSTQSKVTIGFLAQKLLIHWKDLKMVFRIPRQEREKRHDDELEADKRSQEEELRRAQGLPIHDKRSLDKSDSISGLLGNKRLRVNMQTYNDRRMNRRNYINYSNLQNNNQNNNSNIAGNNIIINAGSGGGIINNGQPKLSKETHRQMFEFKHAHSEYQEALKKYNEQIKMFKSQLLQKLNNTTNNVANNPNNEAPRHTPQQSPSTTLTSQLTSFNDLFYNNTNNNQYSNDLSPLIYRNVTDPVTSYQLNQFMELFQQQQQSISTVTTTGIDFMDNSMNLQLLTDVNDHSNVNDNYDHSMEVDFKDLLPNYESPLVMLSSDHHTIPGDGVGGGCLNNDQNNSISTYAIDNVDFSQIKFENDNYIESMEKRMFDEIYPPAGIFYVTNNGDRYFVSFPEDLSQGMNIKENITEPLPLSFTEKPPDERLLVYGWKYCTTEDGHHYYYNKRKHIKQWHPPQDNQIDGPFVPDDTLISTGDISHPSASSTPASGSLLHKNEPEGSSMEDFNRKNAKRNQERFRNQVSQFVVKCLNPYMKKSCRKARITNSDDFKSLARKITHTILGKEMKQVKNAKDLAYTDSVKNKTKEYVKRYMSRFGSVYKAESSREDIKSPNSPNNFD